MVNYSFFALFFPNITVNFFSAYSSACRNTQNCTHRNMYVQKTCTHRKLYIQKHVCTENMYTQKTVHSKSVHFSELSQMKAIIESMLRKRNKIFPAP